MIECSNYYVCNKSMESIKEEPVQIIDPIQEKFLELAENN